MKKVLSMALALCLVLSMTACGSSSSGGDSADTSSDAQSQSQRVQPLAGAEIDTANLADGTYAVSFTPADVIDNAGQLQLHFTVYD